jgi:hypothetical protein
MVKVGIFSVSFEKCLSVDYYLKCIKKSSILAQNRSDFRESTLLLSLTMDLFYNLFCDQFKPIIFEDNLYLNYTALNSYFFNNFTFFYQ